MDSFNVATLIGSTPNGVECCRTSTSALGCSAAHCPVTLERCLSPSRGASGVLLYLGSRSLRPVAVLTLKSFRISCWAQGSLGSLVCVDLGDHAGFSERWDVCVLQVEMLRATPEAQEGEWLWGLTVPVEAGLSCAPVVADIKEGCAGESTPGKSHTFSLGSHLVCPSVEWHDVSCISANQVDMEQPPSRAGLGCRGSSDPGPP